MTGRPQNGSRSRPEAAHEQRERAPLAAMLSGAGRGRAAGP